MFVEEQSGEQIEGLLLAVGLFAARDQKGPRGKDRRFQKPAGGYRVASVFEVALDEVEDAGSALARPAPESEKSSLASQSM